MASASSLFELSSTQTSLSIIVPAYLSTDVNALRSVHDKHCIRWSHFRSHDKSFWPAHLNILYPFVDPEQLLPALEILRQKLCEVPEELKINIVGVDTFNHRQNGTVFMKPDNETQKSLGRLRSILVQALGRSETEGTIDGEFRPHLTIGQASLRGNAVDTLVEKARQLGPISWKCTALTVLERTTYGDMRAVVELPMGAPTKDKLLVDRGASKLDWTACFQGKRPGHWEYCAEPCHSYDDTPASFQVSTWNLMVEPFAPPPEDRVSLIVEEIKNITAKSKAWLKILCFQEVNENMLSLLLSDPFISENYRYSSHRNDSVLPSERNLLTLASAPFLQRTIYFNEKHKSALCAFFEDMDLVIANVHLTSGLNNEAIEAKSDQLEALYNFFSTVSNYNQEIDPIIVGDFNIVTSAISIQAALDSGVITQDTLSNLQDYIGTWSWIDAFNLPAKRVGFDNDSLDLADGEQGATFDPTNNAFAAMSPRLTDFRPQRYDRIVLSRGLPVKLEQFERFGLHPVQGTYPSDHYGISATLRYNGPSEATSLPLPAVKDSSINKTRAVELKVVHEETDLDQVLIPYLPKREDTQRREQAISVLHRRLNSDSRLSNLLLLQLGSYAMGTYFADSDVDTLAIGSLTSKAFFEVATARLKLINGDDRASNNSNGLRAVHMVNSLVPIIEVFVNGIKFDVQYCQAPELLQRYHAPNNESTISDLVFDKALMSKLSSGSLRPLNTYRDTRTLLHSTPSLPAYITAHRFLALYLKARGLYSAKFGYLGGIHLSLLLHHLLKSLPESQKGIAASPASLVRTFFAYFADFDWAGRVVDDAGVAWHRSYSRSGREPVVILALHSPTSRTNVAGSCTKLSAREITEEFRMAKEKLDGGEEGWRWCLRAKEEVAREFLKAWGAFVRIKVDVWDIKKSEREKAREIVGGVESRITMLMVALGKIVGFSLRAKVWPGRFRLDEVGVDDTVISGYYLVGVSAKEEGVSTEQKKVLQGKVLNAARSFESELRASAMLKDVQNVWIEVDVVSRKKIAEMSLVFDL